MDKININETVWFKPTDKTFDLLQKDHVDFWYNVAAPEKFISDRIKEYSPPSVDANGYCKMQLWVLMESLGKYMTLGQESPIEGGMLYLTQPSE